MNSLRIRLLTTTSPDWPKVVLEDFNSFLIDHAACERKASATGLQFVLRYPERTHLIDPMIRLAREELFHFHQVSQIMLARGLISKSDEKTPYINALLKQLRNGREENLLDRLLVFGITEARGCERFRLVGEALPPSEPELKKFYQDLSAAEERHHETFVELALLYFSPEQVRERLTELLSFEADLIQRLPLRAAVH